MILNTWSIFAGKFSQVEGYNGYSSETEIPNVLLRCSGTIPVNTIVYSLNLDNSYKLIFYFECIFSVVLLI